MFSLFESKSNCPEATILLLNALNVKVPETIIVRDIEEHPDYPSLLSISDALNSYGMENMAIEVDANKLAEVPAPFITQIIGIEKRIDFFTVVRAINTESVHFFDPEKHQWVFDSLNNFQLRCSRIILLTERSEHVGENDFAVQIRNEQLSKIARLSIIFFIPAIVVISGLLTLIQDGIPALLPFLFSLFTLSGAGVGLLLIWYELDQYNPTLQQICSSGKRINCAAVLQSKAAKVMGISWSTIGFSYFSGMSLLLLLGGMNNSGTLFIVAWLNIIAVPYTVFSIYYQWHIAKQWCILCLFIQGLLVSQLIMAIIGNWHTLILLDNITIRLTIQTIATLAIPFIVATILLSALQKSKESKRIKTELQKLKHNREIFDALLQKQKIVENNPDGLGIILGNPNATHRLIKVCNPYCGPCAKAHQPMEDLLHNNPDVQIQILFTATNEETDVNTPVVKHLLAIAEKNEESFIKQALDDWYLAEKKDYEAFAAKYPITKALKQQGDKIEAMNDWCEKIAVDFTPTFFISTNNEMHKIKYHQLPDIYSVKDLKYFFSA
jgi:uncharacterized membrane protein/protein-disulfide isomerase